MIPKVIHYCWFGNNPLPPKAIKCINSWKKYCPEFKIKEWNESNIDVYMNSYTKRTYDEKKYAFFSDYIRLKIIEENGGFYFDTDVEIVKPLDDLVELDAFCGFETDDFVNTGIGFGAKKGHPMITAMLNEYEVLMTNNEVIGCPILNTKALVKYGLVKDGKKQCLENNIMVFPQDYFNPYDDPTGTLNKTSNTYSIHWFAKTWMSKKKRVRSALTKPLHRLFGTELRKRG